MIAFVVALALVSGVVVADTSNCRLSWQAYPDEQVHGLVQQAGITTEAGCKSFCEAREDCWTLDFNKVFNTCWWSSVRNPTDREAQKETDHFDLTRDCSVGCRTQKLGTAYKGTLSVTKSGHPCQAWASQTPHSHKVWTGFPEGSQAAAKNYCRNPDKEPNGPWCYTTDPAKRWESCDVKYCECKATKKGTEYGGTVSTTVTGRKCQAWTSQAPHTHKVWTDFPEGSQAAANNYCRNPDGESDGPWCYTTDPAKRWEYCEVKLC
jgi:hypothetical protein